MTLYRDDSVLPIHDYTGCRAVGIVNGRPVWPIKGGSGEGDGGEGGDDGQGGVATYTPPASQADLDRIIQDRLSRERKQYGMTADEAKAFKDRAEALEHDLSSETDKAVEAARDEARAEALAEANPRAARAEFKAEAKGILTPEQLEALIEDIDLTRYIGDDGEPDTAKIAAKIAKFAPVKGAGAQPPRPLGQGHQHSAQPSARDLGRAEAEKRFGKK